VACFIIERTVGTQISELLWIAEDDDWRVLRHECVRRDKPEWQITITYDDREDVGNVPRGWTSFLATMPSGIVHETSAARILKLDLNTPIESSNFSYQFPVGTLVKDELSGMRSIARADGSLRPISAGELAAGVNLEQLMRTEPPPEARPLQDRGVVWMGRRGVLWTLLVALSVCVVLKVGFARQLRNRI
jgi:hypothetical protein